MGFEQIQPLQIHKTNRVVVKRLTSLTDPEGKGLLSQIQMNIILTIARFDRTKGNFMSDTKLCGALPGKKISIKTLRRHLKYFKEYGLISVAVEKGRKVRRLECPSCEMIESTVSFRKRTNEPGYKMTKKTEPELNFDLDCPQNPSFFVHPEGQIVPVEVDNLSSFTQAEDKQFFELKKEKKTPPFTPLPFVAKKKETPAESQKPGQTADPANLEGCRPQVSGEKLLKTPKEKKIKIPKETKKIAATKLQLAGHICNPMGKPNTTGRELKPNRARAINSDDNSAVTLAELWKAYIEIYDTTFGPQADGTSILPTLIAGTRENVTRFFDELKQVFIKTCGYDPTYRELYDYLKWFHEPSRVQSFTKAKSVPYVHPSVLKGAVFTRTFYDRVLKFKGKENIADFSEAVKEKRQITEMVHEAYDKIRNSGEDNFELVYSIVNYGLVIFGEYLKDYKGCDGSSAKERIISLFADHIKESNNKEVSIRFIRRAWKTTQHNTFVTSSIWVDWKVECENLLELACKKAGVNLDAFPKE